MLSLLRLAPVWLLFSVQVGYAAERYEMRNSVPRRATLERWMRAADADESLDMSITLRLEQAEALAALLSAQQDPQSAQYHRWLTPEEFAARFAPTPEKCGAVVDWLQGEGFTVRPQVSGARVDFRGTVARVERTFGVRMHHYDDGGRTPLANENPPLLPSALADGVAFVRLNTFPLAEPQVRTTLAGRLVTAMAPADMYVAYGMRKLLDSGVDGSGQTIAVVARSDFNVSDVTSFGQQFGVRLHDPVKAFPAGSPGVGAANGVCQSIRNPRQRDLCIQGEEAEVLLDTQWAAAMAPGATVLVDISDADIDASLTDIVVHHPEAKTITMSFAACERLDASDRDLFGPLYAQAAAQGQTVVVASGDDGADGCLDGQHRGVNVLASDPNVTAIGGTALDPGFDASGNATGYVGESVWNDDGGASGGGVSTLVTKPAYQSAPGVPADGFRDLPDVSLLASPSQAGYVMVLEGGVDITGGTSAAAPSWAGIVALLNHALRADGLGALNPTLYMLGRQQYAASGPAVFHDVIRGDNSADGVQGYSAGVGYDLATGLGTPDVAMLAQALGATIDTPSPAPTPTATATLTAVATATTPPTPTPTLLSSSCAGDCNGDHSVTIDEILTLVSISLGDAGPSGCAAGDVNHDGVVTIDELLLAVRDALNGCAG